MMTVTYVFSAKSKKKREKRLENLGTDALMRQFSVIMQITIWLTIFDEVARSPPAKWQARMAQKRNSSYFVSSEFSGNTVSLVFAFCFTDTQWSFIRQKCSSEYSLFFQRDANTKVRA